jgi:DNA repair exonuclease SbcCD nuclease subunit
VTSELDRAKSNSERERPVKIRISPVPYAGLLFIGDPHIESRTPGFRRDNYPEAILRKLQWAIEYARQHRLQPILLGDVFDKPRDNPNWILARLLDLFSGEPVLSIFGNHDCANPQLDENDSLMILAKAGAIALLDASNLWACCIEDRWVLVGGSPYRHPIPDAFSLAHAEIIFECVDQARRDSLCHAIRSSCESVDRKYPSALLTLWLTHHDLTFPNAEEAVVTNLTEIPGIDYVLNGHIHRRASSDVVRGQTTWMNPGNIARRSRSDSIRGHVPAVLRLDVTNEGQWFHYITLPHAPQEEVFYDLDGIDGSEATSDRSSFVSGLALLQSRKTESGAGLLKFLDDNLSQFDLEVAQEIRRLAQQVVAHAEESIPN